MKNFQKITLALIAGAMAIGFSAFINAAENAVKITRTANGRVTFTADYYRKVANAGGTTDMNADHYIFSTNSGNGCVSNPGDICKATWTTTAQPLNGDTPADAGAPSFVGNAGPGDYNGL